MLFSGWVNHLRKTTLASTSASVVFATAIPAPCWTETFSQPSKCGVGRTFSSMSWLSVSLSITCVGK